MSEDILPLSLPLILPIFYHVRKIRGAEIEALSGDKILFPPFYFPPVFFSSKFIDTRF